MSKPEDEAVAIVGYGGVFPGAGDPEGLWANIVEAVDATTEVPPGRWLLAPAQAFDPRIPQPDKVYCHARRIRRRGRARPRGVEP